MTVICNSAAQAVQCVGHNDRIWCHSMAATPVVLLEALASHLKQQAIHGVQLLQLHLEGAEVLCTPELANHLTHRCFFASRSTRGLINQGLADYVPAFLSEIPNLIRRGEQPVDIAVIQVSPPDKHGNCSLGVSVEATLAACERAETIIAQVNSQMPRTHGDSLIKLADIDYLVEVDTELPCVEVAKPNQVVSRIGQYIAELIDDGDCLQMGIGDIPNAVLGCLTNHQNLGVHSEMFSDGVLPLVEAGVINNSRKSLHPGKLVTGFVLGSRALYDFVDDNPEVAFLDIGYVNNPAVIRKNRQMVSINSALQIDLTGQVCADSIGSHIYSGVGGQVDFVTGAQLSEGGRSIIAFPATASGGKISRIVPQLTPGAGVVTSRAQVDYVVTEYGIASLRGASLRERAKRLNAIAAPQFRE